MQGGHAHGGEGRLRRVVTRAARKRALPPERSRRIAEALDAVRLRCDNAARLAADPVRFVHAYQRLEDQEVVAVIASSLAFGNAKAFGAKIAIVLDRLGPSPAAAADDAAGLRRALASFKHRFCTGADLACLVIGARAVQRDAGSLGRALAMELESHGGELLPGLVAWTDRIRKAGGLDRRKTHGARHILPRADLGSANKRMMLMLRWMVRPADGVDLGLWDIPASRLVMPLDVHIHKLSRNIGLTNRTQASWKAAVDITEELARIDRADPTRYDFALCHLGMVQRCPSRKDPVRCEGCGVKPICRHWSRSRANAEP